MTELRALEAEILLTDKTALKEIYDIISDNLNAVEKKLEEFSSEIKQYSSSFPYIKEVTDYFFRIPGKKLRPALAFMTAGAAAHKDFTDTDKENILLFATAIEMIHSASLIHDDIIDNDIMRRGQDTMSKKFGIQTSVLAGDMIYARAFSMLTDLKLNDSALKNRIIKDVCNVSRAMCAGEIEEISCQNNFTREQYIDVVDKKTASLMAVSCRGPALMLSSDPEIIGVFERFGHNIGVLYQAVDDFADKNVEVIDFSLADYISRKAEETRDSIRGLKKSKYSNRMMSLIDYISNYEGA